MVDCVQQDILHQWDGAVQVDDREVTKEASGERGRWDCRSEEELEVSMDEQAMPTEINHSSITCRIIFIVTFDLIFRNNLYRK